MTDFFLAKNPECYLIIFVFLRAGNRWFRMQTWKTMDMERMDGDLNLLFSDSGLQVNVSFLGNIVFRAL